LRATTLATASFKDEVAVTTATASTASTPTRQFAGLIVARIQPESLEPLRRLLAVIDHETIASSRGEAPAHPIIPFRELETVHYARFVLLDRQEPVRLAFATDYDGPLGASECREVDAWERHLDDLMAHAREGLERVFAHCQGYRAGELRAYLSRHRLKAATFYAGASGRSKGQILWEAALRREIDQVVEALDPRRALTRAERARLTKKLQQLGLSQKPEELLRERVVERLARQVPAFPAQPDEKKKVDQWLRRRGALVLGSCALAVCAGPALWGVPAWWVLGGLVGAASCALARFRYLELTDEQFQPEHTRDALEQLERASAGENELAQNQLTHLVQLKPGPLRRLVVSVVFSALQVRARHLYNKGKLGGIPSIHFARWALLEGRDVLFFSNFDNSWQSYLGDFIDRASSGLTAVWSNTRKYPRTRWLLRAGSRDASRFLAWTRAHQLPTQVWYCAYPGLSIVNINDNTEIRRGLSNRTEVDAADWLLRLRSVDRLHVDQLDGDERTNDPSLALKDIQGLILWGYGDRPDARYLLLQVKDAVTPQAGAAALPAPLRWLAGLPLHSAEQPAADARSPDVFVNVAFSHEGLTRLGVHEALRSSFSPAFVQGSHHEYRARVNGDAAPERWEWGSKDRPVHVVLFVFARDARSAEQHASRYAAEAQAAGFALVTTLEARTLPGRKEHFGFRDGIAQPTIQGSGRAELDGNTLGAGELLLGHRDGYGNVTHSPHSPTGFNVGLNGSYLVLRQLEQDVVKFWSHCADQALELGLVGPDAPGDALAAGAIRVASKMVGRWPSGAPLVRHPDADPMAAQFENEDDFTYVRNDEDNDRHGARCPFGSHVRRTNPRDWRMADDREEALRLSNLHRIVRRGRPYGEPLDASMDPRALIARSLASAERPSALEANGTGSNGTGSNGTPSNGELGRRGLQFMCFNANIDRQFEFIQQQWCNNRKFAGLSNDPDPLLGAPPGGGAAAPPELGLAPGEFTLQSGVGAQIHKRGNALGQFVQVVGSGYFFMPSIPAVRLLGRGLLADPGVPGLEHIPPDEQLHIDGLIETLGAKMKGDYEGARTLRDGHPKMHGCVRAVFHVAPGLPEELRVGLFGEAASYPAWVRFSNESGRVTSDAQKDVLGVAIKLMGVPGPKLLEGEEGCQTFDFVMTNRPAFFARDAAEFARMMRALVGKRLLPFLLRQPRVLRSLTRWRRLHSSPLETQYFSGLPYLLGGEPVKYSLRPSGATTTASPAKRPDDYLRQVMVSTLAHEGVCFDFLVQSRPGALPIEDGTVIWDERRAPFRKVASLEIPQQRFAMPERDVFGDNLSFNPWRCLPEHRPLGGLNRARRQVYRALSELRHARNAAPRVEPSHGAREGSPEQRWLSETPTAPPPSPERERDSGIQELGLGEAGLADDTAAESA
jgi:Dyp-type peroxidase family